MDNGYKKFKKKIILETTIKTIIFALSIGLICSFTLLLIDKLLLIGFNPLIIVGSGLLLTLISGVVLFFIIKPSEKKIATRMDHELNLNEKVQTMIAYKDLDDDIIKVQREDTLSKLNSTSKKSLKFKMNPFYYVILVLAIGLTTTSLTIPAKQPQVEPPLPDYDVDNWSIQAIKDLILDVKESNLNEDIKNEYIAELQFLLDNVDENGVIKRELVDQCLVNIYSICAKYNAIDDIYPIFENSNCINAKTFASGLNSLSMDSLNVAIGLLKISFTNENYTDNINEFNERFGKVLKESKVADSAMKSELLAFSDSIFNCLSEVIFDDAFDEAFLTHSTLIKALFEDEVNNVAMRKYLTKKLCSIFGITNPDEEGKVDDPSEEENPEEQQKEKIHSGGMGTGEIIVGSDDIIYDPDLGYVSYSQVINSYNAVIINMLEEGLINEEYKIYLQDYFDKLYGINQLDEEGE